MALISRAPTSVAAFVVTGQPAGSFAEIARGARRDRLVSEADFTGLGGSDPAADVSRASATPAYLPLFFANGGTQAHLVRVAEGFPLAAGLALLDQVDGLGLLCLPGETQPEVLEEALHYADRRRALLIVDPPEAGVDEAVALNRALARSGSANAAVFVPPVLVRPAATGEPSPCPAGGAVAGVYARTDEVRGVWKAAAGSHALVLGVEGLAASLDQQAVERLVVEGVNPLRAFPGSPPLVWGARTIQGADDLASDWKYVPVRRLALLIEESIDRGVQWAVFEPNDEPLWARLRSSVEEFLHELFRDGAFPGATPDEAYFVRCDQATMTQNDIEDGRAIVLVGFAPLKPAEFVTIRIGVKAAPATAGERVSGETLVTGESGETTADRHSAEPKHRRESSHWWGRLKAWFAKLLGE